MTMALYLGIDGGGTKTKVCVIDQNRQIIYEGKGGPSSTDTVPPDVTYKSIKNALAGFKPPTPEKPVFQAVFAGLGGVLTEADFKQVEIILRKIPLIGKTTRIRVRNDMEIALASGEAFDEGIVLICGTGMVAYGRDTQGNTYKSGGWGYHEGDAGSAYDLGVQALRTAVRSLDGRIMDDDFTRAVKHKTHLRYTSDIVPVVARYHADRTLTAALAPLVTEHADQGNAYAMNIIDKATSELALAVKAVHDHLVLNKRRVVIVGALGNAGGLFGTLLKKKIMAIDSLFKIQGPVIDPAYAAAILAMQS
ncbi:MAG: hypothetical protein EA375_01705 [Acholeplasmataceae bacterium]|nr:MAG: hypothetical protein EA375_01705 [Acholeplasmataceae bacterium]